ncbi:MAG: hypothetical protein JWN14_3380 [Chthonomonadales bacterium]|nr:hypothetical protein [Chthonomonadales bacterium]
MNHLPIDRSFYGLATIGTLLLVAGTLSLVASARQSPPSPAQVKKVIPIAPPRTANKPVTLPGLDKPSGKQAGAPLPSAGPQKQGQGLLAMDDTDLNEKSSLSKGKNFVYTEGDMKFTGMAAVYNKKSQELDAQGSLVLDDPKHHVTGDKSHVDTTKKLAVLTGNIVITLKPAPPDPNAPANQDAEKERKYPVIITCDRAEDSYKKDFIVLNGHLIFKQTIVKDDGKMVERTLTAEHAEYDGKANKLHLFQPVKAHDTEDQQTDFEKDVFVGTKEGETSLTSPGRSTTKFNLDNATDDAAGPDKTSDDKKTGDKKPPEKKDTPPPATPKTSN